VFTLGKFNFQLDEEASEVDGGYLMFTIYKRNAYNCNNVHNISVLIHSETYELEPFFFYYGNRFGNFKSCTINDSDMWYYGKDKEGWKFVIPKSEKLDDYIIEYPISRESALTLIKVVCTIRDNYEEYVKKMNKEVVELQL